MLLVAVDIGNTNVVIGFLDDGHIAGTYRITTKANHTSDEYGLMITQFLRLSGYAPVYVDSELVYSYLTAEPQIEATLKKAGTVDIILTGIGSLNDANGSLYKSGCYNAEERKELMRRGAVSSLLGRMFDINGNEVQLDSRYVISAPLEAMRTPSWSIGINASAEKAECTLAAVHGKYINVLVADEALARRMLEMEGVAVPE